MICAAMAGDEGGRRASCLRDSPPAVLQRGDEVQARFLERRGTATRFFSIRRTHVSDREYRENTSAESRDLSPWGEMQLGTRSAPEFRIDASWSRRVQNKKSMRRIAAIALVVHAFACAADSSDESRPSTSACEKLREHVIDIRVAEVQQDRDAHREALRRALGKEFVGRCVEEPRARYECEMKATSIDGLRNCTTVDRP